MRWLLPLLCLGAAGVSRSAEILRVSWKTAHAASPPQFSPPASDYLPGFRLALSVMPESAIVALSLSQPALLGLTQTKAASMRAPVAERYALIAKSPEYSAVASALPYCFAEKRPQEGLALVHVPTDANAQTPVLLFLHGYGGSFLWYQHLLAEHFQNHVIVCPAYGINTSTIAPEYVQECLAAVSAQLARPIIKPGLLGLSAGGVGACYLYTRHPERFACLVCMAASPPEDTLPKFSASSRAAFIAGDKEPFVKSGDYVRRITEVKRSAPLTQAFLVGEADHFFLLTHGDTTMAKLREWLTQFAP